MGAIKKPKPFVRPSVSISSEHDEVAREWQHVEPYSLAEGDIVADRGKILRLVGETFTLQDPYAVLIRVTAEFPSRTEKYECRLRPDITLSSDWRGWHYDGPKIFAFTAGDLPAIFRQRDSRG